MIISTFTSQVCFHPKDPKIIYTGSAQGLQVSKDAGNLASLDEGKALEGRMGKHIGCIEVDRDNTDLMFVNYGDETYASTDAGLPGSSARR